METKRARKVQNKRNSFIPTKVCGVRAELSWWEMCKDVAKKHGISTNELVVKSVKEYCENKLGQNNNVK